MMSTLLDKIETPELQRLYRYWEESRRGRDFPARRDIDPLHFPYILGSVLLLDVLYEPLRFRFRLHGTDLVLRAGYDMTGKMADALPNAENRAVLLQRCHTLIETRQPMVVIRDRLLGKQIFGYEALWLPLSEDGTTIDMLMGALVYRQPASDSARGWRPSSAA